MPLLKFTESDRLASIVIPTGWYRLEITEIDGPKAAASGKEGSINIFMKFQVVEGPYQGKSFDQCFNTKLRTPLGTLLPTAMVLQLAAAIKNTSLDQVSLELDTEEILRKPFDGKIDKSILEGIPQNTFLTFLPAGTGKDATAPF